MRTRRSAGMTLIEITIAAAVGTILSAAALQLFTSLVKYSRLTSMTTDIQDRIRIAREVITHDVLRAGYYWAKEDDDGGAFTGFFAPAGVSAGVAAGWPTVPMSGTDSNAASDELRLVVPNGEVVGGNGRGIISGVVDPAYLCDESSDMVVTVPLTSPQADFTNYTTGAVVLGTGSGVVFLTTITNSTLNPASTSTVTLDNLGSGECAVAGSADGTSLPGRFSIYPVEGVIWKSDGSNLLRCSATDATGPLGMTCNAAYTVVGGVEDFQIRYRYLKVQIDAAGNTTSATACYSEVPTNLTVASEDVAGTCGGSDPKRRVPDGVNGIPMVRFVGFDVGIVARSLKEDVRENLGRSRRPALFNHPAAGSSDSYRRRSAEWRVVTPNVYVF